MKVAELKKQIDQIEQVQNLDKMTVEVVYKGQKYFIQRIDNPEGNLNLLISRQFYHSLSLDQFKTYLVQYADSEGQCYFKTPEGSNPIGIESVYKSDWFLELVAAS